MSCVGLQVAMFGTLKFIGTLFTEIFGAIPYETPTFTVLASFPPNKELGLPAVQIRKYSPSVCAEVHMCNDLSGAFRPSFFVPFKVHLSDFEPQTVSRANFSSTAFRLLAGYIGVFNKPQNFKRRSSLLKAFTFVIN